MSTFAIPQAVNNPPKTKSLPKTDVSVGSKSPGSGKFPERKKLQVGANCFVLRNTRGFKTDDKQKKIAENMKGKNGVDHPLMLATGTLVKIQNDDGSGYVRIVDGNNETHWINSKDVSNAINKSLKGDKIYWSENSMVLNGVLNPVTGGATVLKIPAATDVKSRDEVLVNNISYSYLVIKNDKTFDDLGWYRTSDLHKLGKKPADTGSGFSKFDNNGADWNPSDSEVAAKVWEAIKSNRKNVNDHSDKETFKAELYKSGNGYTYNGKNLGNVTLPLPATIGSVANAGKATGFDASQSVIINKIEAAILAETASEGGFSSINTYDAEKFTWGKGFAGKNGALPAVLSILYNLPADKQVGKKSIDFKQIFKNVGISVEGGELKTVVNGKILTGREALVNAVSADTHLMSFFIELAEKQDYRDDVSSAQVGYILRTHTGDPKIPMWFLNKCTNKKDDYVSSLWNDDIVRLLFHLWHWLPAGNSWAGSPQHDYSNTNGNAMQIVYDFITQAIFSSAVKESELEDDKVRVWNRGLILSDRMSAFVGGIYHAGFEKSWPATNILDKRKRTDGSNKDRVYIAGSTNQYLYNCIVIPPSEASIPNRGPVKANKQKWETEHKKNKDIPFVPLTDAELPEKYRVIIPLANNFNDHIKTES